jgi:glycosyltransferase involved in cell wall biosynthesis
LTIAPIRFGAGVKGKVLESLACGTPCVLTEMAAEGIPFDKHRRLFVGDGDNLVQNVVGVYSNTKLQRVIIKSGLELIEANFSQRIVTETLGGMLGMRRQNFPVKARDMVA